MNKCYSELITIPTFEERIRYLQTHSTIGSITFGHDRFINQALYNSYQWRKFRRDIILRDNACDLAHPDYEVASWIDKDGNLRSDKIVIHHIVPLTVDDIVNRDPKVFDRENVVCTTDQTHKIIHYKTEQQTQTTFVERTKNDTSPWRQ